MICDKGTGCPDCLNRLPYYFTFGQAHVHKVNGTLFDKDCVALIRASSEGEARAIAVRLFELRWCTSYPEIPNMSYYPRGILEVK